MWRMWGRIFDVCGIRSKWGPAWNEQALLALHYLSLFAFALLISKLKVSFLFPHLSLIFYLFITIFSQNVSLKKDKLQYSWHKVWKRKKIKQGERKAGGKRFISSAYELLPNGLSQTLQSASNKKWVVWPLHLPRNFKLQRRKQETRVERKTLDLLDPSHFSKTLFDTNWRFKAWNVWPET